MHKTNTSLSLGNSLAATACVAFLVLSGGAHAQQSLNTQTAFDIGTGVPLYSSSLLNLGPVFDTPNVTTPVAASGKLRKLTRFPGFGIAPVAPPPFASSISQTSAPVILPAINAPEPAPAAPVPEPATAIWGVGLMASAALSRKRRQMR